MKQIIVSGGGGFNKKENHFALEKYIIAQTNTPNPSICLLPQASNECPSYIDKFFDACAAVGAQPSWISLFGRVESSWKDKLLNADIIYVGGGNTKSMIALWKAWGVDVVLREAYEKGRVMAGVSAGMICWFEQGISDSMWPLGVVDGLGFLSGSCCPHFDSEKERRSAYASKLASNEIQPGIALQENTFAHYIDGKLHAIYAVVSGKKAFYVTHDGIKELKIVTL